MSRQSYPLAPSDPPPLRGAGQGIRVLPAALAAADEKLSLHDLAEYLVRLATDIREIAETVNGARDGKLNSVGDVTLTASSATTTLSDARIGPNSFIQFMPTTANAAAACQDSSFYVSARDKGTATITHTNDANNDKTFTYLVIG